MAHPVSQKGETLKLVKELVKVFSNNYPQKEKLREIVKKVEYTYRLFVKLSTVVEKYDQQGKNIDKQGNFAKQLRDFKQLLEENISKTTHRHDIVLSIEDYLSAIRKDYKILRNYVQTLEDINAKIEKKASNHKDKHKIGELIIRGVEEKIPNLIYFEATKPNDDDRKLNAVKRFYSFFVMYISFIRETLENSFDDEKYCSKLDDVQSKLLSRKPSDIKDYFSKMMVELKKKRGYSTEILIRSFSKNPIVHISVANHSELYSPILFRTFETLSQSSTTLSDKRCIEPLTTLVYELDEENFKKLHRQIFINDVIINLVCKLIYDKGIELYTNATANQNEPFQSTALKNANTLKKRFEDTFEIIFEEKPTLFDKVRDLVIDEKNSSETFRLLSNIYGQRIRSLNFSDDIANVKYCFNYHFFTSLKVQELDDVPEPKLFARLLFYIHAHDHIQILNNVTKTYINDEKKKHRDNLFKLRTEFLEVYKENNNLYINDLVEMLKIMINIQSYDFRLNLSTRILIQLKTESDNEQLNSKIETLKEFFHKANNQKEVCLRLAQSFNIHLLKDVLKDHNIVLQKLREFNSNFELFIKHNKESNKTFDIDKDLVPSFSIPYFLSAKLTEDDRYNNRSGDYNENNYQIVMAILFRVFNCSSDKDRKEFLRSKNEINEEFVKLFKSVKKIIEFYDQEDYKYIYKQLRSISIGHIEDGFNNNGSNDDSLKDRNEYARIIIDNFINYKMEHVMKVFDSTKSLEAIINTFNNVLKAKDNYTLNQWAENTSKLSDKLYFLYCYYQYSQQQFDGWFKQMNSQASSDIYEMIKNKRKIVEKEFQENSEAFNQLNIKYLQHNQVGALALIYDHLEDETKKTNNLFIKIGTGQGKSLTIAETARKIIQMSRKSGQTNQKVFVITCYDHLAKRDFENYQSYYKYFDIKSMHCSSESSTKEFADCDVIYADLDTYFDALREDAFNALTKSCRIALPDINNAVLIMDEFDSLILDSDHIFQRVFYFSLPHKNQGKRFDHKEDIRDLFKGIFTGQTERKFSGVFDRWAGQLIKEKIEEDQKKETTKLQDTLGKDHSFAGSFLNHFKQYSAVNFVHFYLDPLVFYSKFKQVIGFSGSITADGISKFEALFENRKSFYYEIPPFFGIVNFQKNRTFENERDKRVFDSRDDYLRAIRQEIIKRHKEQPILIFAESFKQENQEKSEYDYIYEKLLEAKDTFLKNSTIITIQKEADIDRNIHKIGKLGSITLATRIIGRGADIKVDKDIKKGLHLLLTYYPERENIYIQMLGRTARQDEKGSYSEITRSVKNFKKVEQVKVNAKTKIYHNVCEYFFKNFPSNSTDPSLGVKWCLFSCLMQNLCINEMTEKDLIDFVKSNF